MLHTMAMLNTAVSRVCLRQAFIMYSMLMVVITKSQNYYEEVDQEELKSQLEIDPYTHHQLPALKMLKRQVKDFRTGRNATLTLVFHSKLPLDVHWFRKYTDGNDHTVHPILEDDPRYEIKNIYSGDVTAATLIIPKTYHNEPHVIETVLTPKDGMMQYQINTVFDKKIVYFVNNIDSPEWLIVPPAEEHINRREYFERHCRTAIRRAKGMNALKLMHAEPLTGFAKESRPQFATLGQTHDAGQQFVAEESSNTILEASFTALRKSAKAVLDVTYIQPEAERQVKGIYICTVERHADGDNLLDKLSLLSLVTFGHHISVIPIKPTVDILTCSSTNAPIPDSEIMFTAGKVACIRCRGLSIPLPEIGIFKDSEDIADLYDSVSVTTFINVAEAGTKEAIYLFRNPQHEMNGDYSCKAHNENGGDERVLTIRVN